MHIDPLFKFIQERHAIHTRRQQGLSKPWTADPILQKYRFCNVYRELDTVTQWIAQHWRNVNDADIWFAMAVARFVNWPETLAEIGFPVPWNPKHFIKVLEARKKRSEKVFTGAYVISASGESGSSKARYVANSILTPMWERSVRQEKIRPLADFTTSCAYFYKKLMEFHGLGSFMAGQIVCDTKYTRLLDQAPDWWDWACSGPGSRRGLNRVLNRPVNQAWEEWEWFAHMTRLYSQISGMIHTAGMPPLHAQDLQNCLCEFDKYERVRRRQGKPRSRYPGV
jgi:hypothetical protein